MTLQTHLSQLQNSNRQVPLRGSPNSQGASRRPWGPGPEWGTGRPAQPQEAPSSENLSSGPHRPGREGTRVTSHPSPQHPNILLREGEQEKGGGHETALYLRLLLPTVPGMLNLKSLRLFSRLKKNQTIPKAGLQVAHKLILKVKLPALVFKKPDQPDQMASRLQNVHGPAPSRHCSR